MRRNDAADVVLVGLGPVGSTLANLLGQYGIDTWVIESSAAASRAPRAISLDHDALRILQMAGLAEGSFPTLPIPFVSLRSPVFGEYARVNTAGRLDGHPKLITFFQPDLDAALRAGLCRHPSVRVFSGTSVVGLEQGGESARVDLRDASGARTSVHARYVVGCDGAGSLIRRTLGLDFVGETYAQDWLIVDTLHPPTPIDHVEFWCDPARPVPHMPAPGGRQRWEFMLRPGETREAMERPEVARELLRPWTRGADVTLERLAVYRFHARIARRFSRGRVFLAGDAAHVTPPFAGQGLVSGLRDAANLAWKLACVVRGFASHDILDSYDTERRPHATATVRLARFMGRLIMPRNLALATVSHGLTRLARLFPPTRGLVGDLDLKPANRFARGLFDRTGKPHFGAGRTLGQGRLRYEGREMPSDDVLGVWPTLLGFGVDPAASLSVALREAWKARGGRFLQIHPSGRPHEGSEVALCEGGGSVLASAPVGWAVLVRPDRVVMCEGRATRSERLVEAALALLASGSGEARGLDTGPG